MSTSEIFAKASALTHFVKPPITSDPSVATMANLLLPVTQGYGLTMSNPH